MRTRADFRMLIFLNLVIGGLRVTESTSRSSGPPFNVPKHFLPMHVWGAFFLVLAVGFVVAAWRQHATTTRVVAGCGLLLWVLWAFMVAASATVGHDHRQVSYVGAVLYIAGSARHFQAIRSP